jgi:hypothetical protein
MAGARPRLRAVKTFEDVRQVVWLIPTPKILDRD